MRRERIGGATPKHGVLRCCPFLFGATTTLRLPAALVALCLPFPSLHLAYATQRAAATVQASRQTIKLLAATNSRSSLVYISPQ